MLRRLYVFTLRLAGSERAPQALGAVSFAESSFFPIPPDVMLIPMVLADRARAWSLALLCTLTSVLGGIAGYLIGALLFEEVALPLLSVYGYGDEFESFAQTYNAWGAWIVLAGGLTPFPFKVITIASGATGLELWTFVLFSLIARAMRFYAVAGLLYAFGPPIRDFIERRLGLVFGLGVLAMASGILALKLFV